MAKLPKYSSFIISGLLLPSLGLLDISLIASSASLPLRLTVGSAAWANPTYSFKGDRRNRPRSSGTGSRGCENKASLQRSSVNLALLVPSDHKGQTASDRPTLYWYMSELQNVRIALVEPRMSTPIIETVIPAKDLKVGINAFEIPRSAKALEPEKTYKWSVAVVCPNVDRFSANPYAESYLKRVGMSQKLQQQLDLKNASAAATLQRAEIYAAEGFWYDALNESYQAMMKKPGDLEVRNDFFSLLKQVGLSDIAEQASKSKI